MAEKVNAEHRSIDAEGVGLLEIDRTVFNWFNQKHPTSINGRKVPVVFGAWERWAQMQGNKEDENLNNQRDQKGMLKLPIISINRGDVAFDNDRFIRKDKYNTPDVTIIKKIAPAPWDQNLRLPFQEKYIRNTGGGTRNWVRNAPVYEVQTIPYPDFINITYTVNFWSSYISHVNKFHEMVWQDAYPTDFSYNGHRFYASIDTQSDEGNIENFSDEERIIRHTFNMNVSAYIIDSNPKIKVNRTANQIKLQEAVVDASMLVLPGEDYPVTLDAIVEAGELAHKFNANLALGDQAVYAITTEDGNMLLTEDDLLLLGDITSPTFVGE
tara:strand:- start:2394 stop:3371 length:978 start_codon:yes stop_codon:yes gene_type:complete